MASWEGGAPPSSPSPPIRRGSGRSKNDSWAAATSTRRRPSGPDRSYFLNHMDSVGFDAPTSSARRRSSAGSAEGSGAARLSTGDRRRRKSEGSRAFAGSRGSGTSKGRQTGSLLDPEWLKDAGISDDESGGREEKKAEGSKDEICGAAESAPDKESIEIASDGGGPAPSPSVGGSSDVLRIGEMSLGDLGSAANDGVSGRKLDSLRGFSSAMRKHDSVRSVLTDADNDDDEIEDIFQDSWVGGDVADIVMTIAEENEFHSVRVVSLGLNQRILDNAGAAEDEVTQLNDVDDEEDEDNEEPLTDLEMDAIASESRASMTSSVDSETAGKKGWGVLCHKLRASENYGSSKNIVAVDESSIHSEQDARAQAVLQRWGSKRSLSSKAIAVLRGISEPAKARKRGGSRGSLGSLESLAEEVDDFGPESQARRGSIGSSFGPLQRRNSLDAAVDTVSQSGGRRSSDPFGGSSPAVPRSRPGLARTHVSSRNILTRRSSNELPHSVSYSRNVIHKGPSFSLSRQSSAKRLTSFADYAGFTGLRKLCNAPMLDGRTDQKWWRVRDRLGTYPSLEDARSCAETREGDAKETALHLACRQKPPPDIIQMLLQASPEPASWKTTSSGWLPLHIECRSGSHPEVVKLLIIDAYPESVNVADTCGNTPLHFAVLNETTPPPFSVLRLLMTPENVSMRSTTGERPITFRYLAERSEKLLDSDKEEKAHAVACLDMLLDQKLDTMTRPGNRETSAFVSVLEDAPEWFLERASVHPYVRAILNWKIVQHFPTALLMLDFYVLLALLVFFRIAAHGSLDARGKLAHATEPNEAPTYADEWPSGACDYFQSVPANSSGFYCSTPPTDSACAQAGDDESHDLSSVGLGLGGPVMIACFGGSYFLARELLQMLLLIRNAQFHQWLWDIWNYLDCLCILMVLRTGYLIQSGNGDIDSVRWLVTMTTSVLWLMMLSFLKLTRRDYAVFVSGVVHVTVTLQSFLVTLSIFLVAFAQMYYTDFQGTLQCITHGSEDVEHDFCTARGSYLRVYMMVADGGIGEEDFTHDSTSLWLSIGFAFLVTILLVNVLIAIVTDSYQDVKNQGETVFWQHRLSFVFEADQISELFVALTPYFLPSWRTDDEEAEDMQLLPEETTTASSGRQSSAAHTAGYGSIAGTEAMKRAHRTRKESKTYMSFLRDLWCIMMLEFEDPSNFSVWRQKSDLKRRFKGPKWLHGDNRNPIVYKDLAVPSLSRRIAFGVFIIVWWLGGILSIGLLWPPQIRRWLICSEVAESNEESKAASSDEIADLRDEVTGEVCRMETSVETQVLEMKAQMDEMRSAMGDMQNMLRSVLELQRQQILADSGMEGIAASEPTSEAVNGLHRGPTSWSDTDIQKTCHAATTGLRRRRSRDSLGRRSSGSETNLLRSTQQSGKPRTNPDFATAMGLQRRSSQS